MFGARAAGVADRLKYIFSIRTRARRDEKTWSFKRLDVSGAA